MTSMKRTATDAARELNASDPLARYTHALQHQREDGTWRDGHLAYTLQEARGVAKAARARTGLPVRVVRIAP